MSTNVRPRGFRQPRCAGCGLTSALCLCRAFVRLDSAVSISVVLPPAERRKSSGTAQLLSLWLARCQVRVVGEADLPDPAPLLERPGGAVLFPGGDGRRSLPTAGSVRHLIVPDGTWRQAKRLERRWFRASGLPRLELDAGWPSVYELRRHPEGPCTFEASAIALGLLGEATLGAELLQRFGEWQRRANAIKRGRGAARETTEGEAPAHPAIARLLAPD